MRVREAFIQTRAQLSGRKIPDASIEAEALMRHVLGLDRAGFFTSLEERLADGRIEEVLDLVRRRLDGTPLAYILGHREFYGLEFAVDRHVLIPRQETELLVDQVLQFASDREREGPLRVADVGAGSGAVGVSVAVHVPQATVYATDISREALQVADVNRHRHGVESRLHLVQGDLLQGLCGAFDVIVSNPPYIRSRDMAGLAAEVGREPPRALDGGADGLAVTERLLRQASSRLRPGGLVLVEIAADQLDPTLALAERTLPGARVSYTRDLLGLPRVVSAALGQRTGAPSHERGRRAAEILPGGSR